MWISVDGATYSRDHGDDGDTVQHHDRTDFLDTIHFYLDVHEIPFSSQGLLKVASSYLLINLKLCLGFFSLRNIHIRQTEENSARSSFQEDVLYCRSSPVV